MQSPTQRYGCHCPPGRPDWARRSAFVLALALIAAAGFAWLCWRGRI